MTEPQPPIETDPTNGLLRKIYAELYANNENQDELLTEIRDSLQSIRSMMTFFTIMLILSIILTACSILGLL